ncbi:MAG: hypothetical protein ACFFER_19175 [Candidatus Thorarchaeota archaeon]
MVSKGRREHMLEMWQDPEFRKRRREACRKEKDRRIKQKLLRELREAAEASGSGEE